LPPAQSTILAPSLAPTIAQSAACRTGDPLANVYHPARLLVRDSCRTVTGTVVLVRREKDGDWHINVRLDARYSSLVNQANKDYQGGALVMEIVPADEPGCTAGSPPKPASGTYDYGTCTGARIAQPGVGERIRVTGPYVLDTLHDWMEIHPVWELRHLSTASSALRITSVTPNPVNPGQYVVLSARAPSRATCSITVTYASGHVSSAGGLEPHTASRTGSVSWRWKVGSSTGAGRATAVVACGSLRASTTFRVR
jgi:hypothetical protein